MPPRSTWLRASPLLAVALLAGCQDYNFNPVRACLYQPGSERVTLSNISTADILFVIDDSGSMGGEQSRLATGFQGFITALDGTNVVRQANGLDPIDFHIALTTTSVFLNTPTTARCRADCPQAAGQLVCCTTSGSGSPISPLTQVRTCAATTDCAAGNTCSTTCSGFLGDKVCCQPDDTPQLTVPVTCDLEGAACGRIETHYRLGGNACTRGIAVDGGRYPQGDFVGAGENPRVLHFDKSLYDGTAGTNCSTGSTCNKQGYTRDQLISFFEQNAVVGTCGSGQEQGLEAARLAIQKAVGGQQRDLRSATGALGSFPADWPHPNAKLVVVFLGDEDDCSSPQDAVKGVILGSPQNGVDACVLQDAKRFPVTDYTTFFEGLGRPLGAGFIVSTQNDTCQDDDCSPGKCCDFTCTGSAAVCTTDVCGGQGDGIRFLQAKAQLKGLGTDTVVGSMCNNAFGTILARIGEIVKPPSALTLSTLPASEKVTVVRIGSGNSTRKTCDGPAPAGTALSAATTGYDWWFTRSADQVTAADRAPSAPSRFIFINTERGNCIANPGETYSAEYIGQLACAGVSDDLATRQDEADAQCAAKFGGVKENWTCFAGLDATNQCLPPPKVTDPAAAGAVFGSCVCGNRQASVCKVP